MKNLFFIILVSILCMPLSHAGFYSQIEENIDGINVKTYDIELQGESGIKNKINDILEKEDLSGCINKDISLSDIQKDIEVEDISSFIENGPCYTDGDITIDKIVNIKKIIDDYKTNSKEISNRKAKNIKKIASLGIYSDGIVKNAEFDIIEDLRLLDNEIFSKKIDFNYEGEEQDSSLGIFNKYEKKTKQLVKKAEDKIKKENKNTNILINNQQNGNNEQNNLVNNNNKDNYDNIKVLSNSYSCTGTTVDGISENNGLSQNTMDFLLNDIKNKTKNGNVIVDQSINNNDFGNKNLTGSINNHTPQGYTPYRKVNDNSQFPCDDIFCITIDFITYNQKLLGGWNAETISIEYLINRSNKHIGKFASNSLVPSKMPNENFELGFKDLNLSDMFHLGFQVTSKPVPILKLIKKEKLDKKEADEFSGDKMLEKYYSALGLDYKRRNDLDIYKSKINEYKTVDDSAELTLEEVVKKQNEFAAIQKKKTKMINMIEKAVENKATNEVLSDFEKQFAEIELFSVSILNYTQKVSAFIKQMKKIPSKT